MQSNQLPHTHTHQDGLWDPRKPCVLGGFCHASCHSKQRSIHDSASSKRFLLSLPPCAPSFLEASFYSDHNLDVAISKVPSSTHCFSEHFLRAVVAGILFILMVVSTTHMPSNVHLWIFLLELQICTPYCLWTTLSHNSLAFQYLCVQNIAQPFSF